MFVLIMRNIMAFQVPLSKIEKSVMQSPSPDFSFSDGPDNMPLIDIGEGVIMQMAQSVHVFSEYHDISDRKIPAAPSYRIEQPMRQKISNLNWASFVLGIAVVIFINKLAELFFN